MTGQAFPIPVIDIGPLVSDCGAPQSTAAEIRHACREFGFFYIVGHSVDERLQQKLEQLSRQFFSQDLDVKLAIRMEKGGRAWRGFFPVGAELTSGQPDQKEGIYFGAELADDHPKVAAGVPMHGPNLFPDIDGFREVVLEYIDAITQVGHTLMRGISLSLGLDASYFRDRYTHDPLILFRVFHYPPLRSPVFSKDGATEEPSSNKINNSQWSVGEHTDYGILTILRQDDTGGLQVKSGSRWIDAPPIPGAFVCNIGDMLDRMTGGVYRSTPHRVRNEAETGRLSFPFFFDPNFDVEVKPIVSNGVARDDKDERWDRSSVHEFSGSYGNYILSKVAKVFPELGRERQ